MLAYTLVMGEEKLHMRKSKPVLVAAGLIWILIGWVYVQNGMPNVAEDAFRHNLLEFADLLLPQLLPVIPSCICHRYWV
ncbi:Na+/H+ antiporter [Alishewanella aestuarii B11]|uniref:Na+/H+ antiporter n=1 Tax=Alishewanella aestuarii B11 TaxID=1197174 RepID=J2IFF4_9ALTE|nr:Na+/H+ antiporter [Alishewanella aestuarii B11]